MRSKILYLREWIDKHSCALALLNFKNKTEGIGWKEKRETCKRYSQIYNIVKISLYIFLKSNQISKIFYNLSNFSKIFFCDLFASADFLNELELIFIRMMRYDPVFIA